MLNRVLGAAVMALAVGTGMPAMGYQAPRITANATKKQRKGLFNGMTYPGEYAIGTKGAGISMAQQKRNATKKRNQRRHKARAR